MSDSARWELGAPSSVTAGRRHIDIMIPGKGVPSDVNIYINGEVHIVPVEFLTPRPSGPGIVDASKLPLPMAACILSIDGSTQMSA